MSTETNPPATAIAPSAPTTTTALAVPAPKTAQVAMNERGIVLSTLDDLWRLSGYIASSGLAPKSIQSREAIFVAVQMGLELGLPPMAALQNIACINGRPAIWGDAMTAVVRNTGELEVFEEWFEIDGHRLQRNPTEYPDTCAAVCKVKRKGMSVAEVAFSVKDAKLAKLWGKDGPWSQYPFRMLRFRARSFALRDQFGDALRGMMTVEEVRDIPPASTIKPLVTVSADEVAALPAAEGEGQ